MELQYPSLSQPYSAPRGERAWATAAAAQHADLGDGGHIGMAWPGKVAKCGDGGGAGPWIGAGADTHNAADCRRGELDFLASRGDRRESVQQLLAQRVL